jgi:outer membrane protein assembly factor BamE (lipoprotein component of BamABCDE complex)
MNRFGKGLFCVFLLVVAACSPQVDNRGHTMQSMDLAQIVKGQSTEEDVRAVLGSPSATSNFGENSWYYITAQKTTVGPLAPEVTQQRVTQILFDDKGVVQEIKKYKKEDGKPVQLVERTTPSAGHSLGFMEQLLGNFGKFGTPGRQITPGRGY